jgi:hypothetical protein
MSRAQLVQNAVKRGRADGNAALRQFDLRGSNVDGTARILDQGKERP